jgi:hypothetical protein
MKIHRTNTMKHLKLDSKNGQNSKFTQHILDTTHEYQTVEKAMKIVHLEKKGQVLDIYMKSVREIYNLIIILPRHIIPYLYK